MSNKCSNGRIDIMQPCTESRFMLYDRIPAKSCDTYHDALTGDWQDNMVSNVFFCGKNIEIIQNGIKAGVYKMSNGSYIIGPQDCDTLKIIMRSIYLQNAKNQPNNITQQVEELNKLVLDYAVPQVYGEAEGYIKYKRDASTLAVPMQAPVSSDYKTKTLELKKWF